MPTTEKAVYIAAAITFFVAWIPAILAQRHGQSRRVSYLASIMLYLFVESGVGWSMFTDPRGDPVGIWAFGHMNRLPPIGYGLPVCLVVLAWDSITYFCKQSSEKKFQARIAQELAEQAREKKRKDYR